MFVGEVAIVLIILLALRKVADRPVGSFGRFDFVGAALSIVGLASTVFGVLRSSEWGVVSSKGGAPKWLGVSPVVWLVLGGLVLIWLFIVYEGHLEKRGGDPLVRPSMLVNSRNDCLTVALLLPVRGPDGCLLRGPWVPLGGTGPVGNPDRRALDYRSRWRFSSLRSAFRSSYLGSRRG